MGLVGVDGRVKHRTFTQDTGFVSHVKLKLRTDFFKITSGNVSTYSICDVTYVTSFPIVD